MPNDDELDLAVAFMVCDHYFDKRKPSREEIAEIVRDRFGFRVSSQKIHDYLTVAREKGWHRLVPPEADSLRKELHEKFYKDEGVQAFEFEPDDVTVVNASDSLLGKPWDGKGLVGKPWSGEHVAAVGADIVSKLIQKLRPPGKAKKRPVRIGLGSGRATLDFSKYLAQIIASTRRFPEIELVAMSAGCPARSPQYAPPSFFNLFPSDRVSFVGMFAETLVRTEEIPEIIKRPGLKEAFALRDQIDIVVTAMGDPRDEHDLLSTFMRESDMPIPNDWVGNVQYRPYTASGPVQEKSGLRPLTLFELEDFIRMAASGDRHVVLLARQCGLCGKSRASALYPLFKKMKVWSRCVMDWRTATDLCQMDESV